MKNNINMFLKGIAGRFSATVVMLALGCFSAIAGNTLEIKDFIIQRGKTATVEVYLKNEDKMSSVEFRLKLPEGLQYVDKSVAKTSRIPGAYTLGVRNWNENKVNAPFNDLSVFVLSTSATIESSLIPDNEGALVTLDFVASDDFKGGVIKISDIMGSDQTNKNEEGKYVSKEIPMADASAKVGLYAGEAYADAETLNVRPNEDVLVGLSFDNVVDVVALQAVITLPEGVSFGEDKVISTDRLSDNINATVREIGNSQYSILVASFGGDVFAGDTGGTLFNLNLKTAEGFTEGEVAISGVKVSTVDGISCNVECKEGKTLTTNIKVVTDPTGDGKWSIQDVYAVINASNSDTPDSICDLNGDGKITIQDVYQAIKMASESK